MQGYTKLFNTIITSSIWSEDNYTRLVWITMLALADKYDNVSGSLPGIADLARVPLKECEKAIDKLLSPDQYSRNTEHEGRRLEAIDGGWHILNREKYRKIANDIERREYMRLKQQEHRKRQKLSKKSNIVNNVNTHKDKDKDKDTKKEKRVKERRFTPPSILEVSEYIKKENYSVDAQQFVDFYTSKGWMVGKNKMRDWQAAVRTWQKREGKGVNRGREDRSFNRDSAVGQKVEM